MLTVGVVTEGSDVDAGVDSLVVGTDWVGGTGGPGVPGVPGVSALGSSFLTSLLLSGLTSSTVELLVGLVVELGSSLAEDESAWFSFFSLGSLSL